MIKNSQQCHYCDETNDINIHASCEHWANIAQTSGTILV